MACAAYKHSTMNKYQYGGGYYNPNQQYYNGYNPNTGMYNPNNAQAPGLDMNKVTTESNQVTNNVPIIGGINQTASGIFDPMRQGFEQYDSQGNLKNPGQAKAGMIAGSFLNPMLALKTRQELGYYGLNPNKYTDALEENRKWQMGLTSNNSPGAQPGGIGYNQYAQNTPKMYNTYGYKNGGELPSYLNGGDWTGNLADQSSRQFAMDAGKSAFKSGAYSQAGAVGGGAAGATIGSVVAGPIGTVVGGAVGGTAGAGYGAAYGAGALDGNGRIGAPRPGGPAPWESQASDGGDDYSYQNNTRGYAWGSQDAGGMYGGGNPMYGMPGIGGGAGGFGYTGHSPFYQSPYGNTPTAYGNYAGWGQSNGISSVPGQNYQPYYGAYKDGGDITPNAMVDDGEIIAGDKPKVANGGTIETVAPGLHKVNGDSTKTDDVAVQSEGDAYVYGNIVLDKNTLNGIMEQAGLSNKYTKHMKEKEVADDLANALKQYRGKDGYVSEEEINMTKSKHEKALNLIRMETENLRREKELQSGNGMKNGGKMPSYVNGGDYTQDDWYQGFMAGNLPSNKEEYSSDTFGKSASFGFDQNTGGSPYAAALPKEGNSFNWSKLPDYINAGERAYGKYGAVNTQNYLDQLYGKGYRLSPGRFNPFGGKAMQEFSDASGRVKRAADQGTEREYVESKRMSDVMKQNLKFLSPTAYAAGLSANDAQSMRRAQGIEDRYINKQASLAGTLANLANQGYNVAGQDTNELRRLDQLNLMSEANYDQLGLMGANVKDNMIQGIGQNAYNEYYMRQAYPYLQTGTYNYPWSK